MAHALILTVIGKDQPGLVEALSDVIAQHEGSWDESRMARLAGHFTGVVQIHLPEDRVGGLIAALPTLADRGLSVSVVESDWSLAVVDHQETWRLKLVGQDRPGIIREISRTLASLGVSVQELRTVIESAPMSGERLFRAQAELVPLANVGFEQIRTALEHLADDMVIDITLKTGKE
ncbi:MAG: ACT domain-containing protein [Nitrospirota bacterium]|nr:ACT domain-containing protein [Nitrospirota bacterium]